MTASGRRDALSAEFHLVAWLVLSRRDGRVLLARRSGVSYAAGLWGLPGGHVERGEPMAAGAAREAAEEVGVTVDPDALAPLAMARWEDGPERGIDVFFGTSAWTGRPEPVAECSEVGWFDPDDLPEDSLDWLPERLRTLSETGWFSDLLDPGPPRPD